MSGWLLIALIVVGLVVVALAILATDVARGDIGPGRHTMQRARRLLVVATDDATLHGAERWIDDERAEHPDRQFLVLCDPEEQDLWMSIQGALDRERPDAIVVARHADERHPALEGVYGRLKEELAVPVDAIYV